GNPERPAMRYQSGFTAVEVLVTLLIAFVLVAGSYQAYNLVVKNTADANDRSVASNIAYNQLRQEIAKVSDTCLAKVTAGTFPAGTILPTPRNLSTAHTCPYGSSSSMTLVTTTLTY